MISGDSGISRPRILFVAVNLPPTDSGNAGELALEQEFATIQRELLLNRYRDFELIHARAVTVDDIMRHLTEQEPLVLHFAGHGAAGPHCGVCSSLTARDIDCAAEDSEFGIYLRDERDRPQLVTIRALKTMIESAAPSVRVVVLNACYSDAPAEVLCETVDCVISMAGAVGDSAARSFSAALYRALGNGRSVGNAFAQAVATLDGKQFPDKVLPKCRTRNRLDAHQMFLTRAPAGEPGQRLPTAAAPTRCCRTAVVAAITALALIAAAAGTELFIRLSRDELVPQRQDDRVPPPPASRPNKPSMGASYANDSAPQPPSQHSERMATAEVQPIHRDMNGAREQTRKDDRPATGASVSAQQDDRVPQSPASTLDRPASSPQHKGAADHSATERPGEGAARHESRRGNPSRTPVPAQSGTPPLPSSAKPVAPVSSLGELDRATVQLYINRHRQRIKHCYEQRLLVQPTLAGTVTARFVVDPEGKVASSTASGLDDEVSSCIADAIKDIAFPRSGSSLKVTMPFQLVPSGS